MITNAAIVVLVAVSYAWLGVLGVAFGRQVARRIHMGRKRESVKTLVAACTPGELAFLDAPLVNSPHPTIYPWAMWRPKKKLTYETIAKSMDPINIIQMEKKDGPHMLYCITAMQMAEGEFHCLVYNATIGKLQVSKVWYK